MQAVFIQFSNGAVMRGAGHVIASIIREGHDLKFFDMYDQDTATICNWIESKPCDLVLMSVMTLNVPAATDLAKKIKKIKNMPIIVGGVHPTITGGQLLEESPEIDYLCIGEGESMIIELMDKLGKEEISGIMNLAYRKDGAVVVNPLRPPEDLSKSAPFPWHLYNKRRLAYDDMTYVYATRGCPYSCTYCCNSKYLNLYGKKYLRKRPIDQVISELVDLKEKYHQKWFYFGDEMILFDKEYAMDLFHAIKKEVGVPYGFMARVEHLSEEVVKVAAETGCVYVAIGVECGDESFRRENLKRSMPNKTIVEAVNRLKAHKIYVTTFNMIGYPFKNDDELTKSTIELNQILKPDCAQVTILFPFPGTELYDKCVRENLLDVQKMNKSSDYYEESVLKDVSLKARRAEIQELLNKDSKPLFKPSIKWRTYFMIRKLIKNPK
jgi:anaerobic magnesium-protoporphyrin IX monomethyl ester cyclase